MKKLWLMFVFMFVLAAPVYAQDVYIGTEYVGGGKGKPVHTYAMDETLVISPGKYQVMTKLVFEDGKVTKCKTEFVKNSSGKWELYQNDRKMLGMTVTNQALLQWIIDQDC